MTFDTDPWPFFKLTITTPRLTLQYANDALLRELTAVADDVIAPGTLPFDGDASFYDRTIHGRRGWLAGQWGARARTSQAWWVLVFAVIVDGHAVGTQEITANSFTTLRTVGTFSWLTRARQGQGLGREMREAVLHLAFAGLGAERATSEAFADNAPSCGVSLATGYVRDGTTWATRQGEAAPMSRFLLTRDVWLTRRRADTRINGLADCLPLLGLELA